MKSLGFFLLFVIVIYLTINYATYKYSRDKTEITVKPVPLPITFHNFFQERSLADDFSEMFSDNIEIKIDMPDKKKVFVPQRFFVNI